MPLFYHKQNQKSAKNQQNSALRLPLKTPLHQAVHQGTIFLS